MVSNKKNKQQKNRTKFKPEIKEQIQFLRVVATLVSEVYGVTFFTPDPIRVHKKSYTDRNTATEGSAPEPLFYYRRNTPPFPDPIGVSYIVAYQKVKKIIFVNR